MIATSPTLLKVLAAVPVLAGTDHHAHALLAQEGKVREFAPGEWIVREGEEGHAFFILVEGDVEVIKRAETAHAVTLATLRQGNFFGEMCVLGPMPRAASIRALTPVQAIEIKGMTLYHLFQKMPDQYAIVLLNLARDMARRLSSLDEAFAARAT
jgi:CRP-like cAMP-binding protein